MNSTELKKIWTQLRSILVFCFKGDFLHIPETLGNVMWSLYSIHDGFKLGLNPPGIVIDPIPWINQLTKILRSEFKLEFSESVLSQAINILLKCLNPDGIYRLWPSIRQIHDFLDYIPDTTIAKKAQYVQSLKNQLEFLLANANGVFDVMRGFDVLEHLIIPGKCAVIDLGNAHPVDAKIQVNLILSQLMYLVSMNRLTIDGTAFVVAIDEGDFLSSEEAGKRYPEGYNVLGQLMKQGREYGIMICLGETDIGNSSEIINSNAGDHYFFNQSNANSIITAARTINEPHATKLLMSQIEGECIAKQSQSPYPFGMLAKIDYIPANREVRPKEFDRHPSIPEAAITDLPEVMKGAKDLVEKASLAKMQTSQRKAGLPANARKLLDLSSCQKIITPTSKLWHLIGNLSPTQKTSIMKKLEDKDLVKFTKIRTGKMWLFLPEITDKGWEFLNKPKYSAGGGGDIIHQFMIQVIHTIGINCGYESYMEHKVSPGNIADVYRIQDGTKVAYEMINTCEKNIIEKLQKYFPESVDEVRLVTLQKSEHKKLEKKIDSVESLKPFSDRIKYESLEPYVKELWP